MPRWTAQSRKGRRTETGMVREVRRGAERGRERRKGRKTWLGRTAGTGSKKESVGRGCVGVLGVVRGGRCWLSSAPTISVTVVTGDWSWRWGVCPWPTLTWKYSRKQRLLTACTPTGWLAIALLWQTRQSDTAGEWQCSTGRRRISL